MDIDEMFGGFDDKPAVGTKREKPTDDSHSDASQQDQPVAKRAKVEEDEDSELSERDEEKMIADIEKLMSVKEVENSTLKMGYNEADYEIRKMEYPNCIHEFIQPKGYERADKFVRPKEMAKQYKFKLDKFQEKAVDCIQKGESVLVAAHTSAGKTAVAEYAIAQSLKNNQRVIYTSPIKALSNQKFRELKAEFGDVGLMTGDVTIDESASCIVMTTEILRSMLYNGSEVTREMAWVIFDEVHYMRDKERGVVWEETIILLPKEVKYCFLSATIPNSREFAEWIVKIKQQPCSVVYTDYRPTPLQHYVFPSGGSGIYLIVDEKGNFREDNFSKAVSHFEGDLDLKKILEEKKQKKKQAKMTMQQEMKKLITLIVSKGLDPCIVFSFSKRECEQYSMSLKQSDFNTEEEKQQIDLIYKNAISTLSEDDQTIPMITMLPELLRRGIGIHHGGLIPIVKEVIELLFQEGLLKILFTTETFAMGINMPAKTVVFTSMEKFDGEEFRYVSGGEFIQMSGRAGRRGLDDRGITILMANKKLEPDSAKAILKGSSDPLYSSFHLGYNMLLNMMRIEDIHPEDIIMHSFHQFQQERLCPQLKEALMSKLTQYKSIQVPNEALIKRKLKLQGQLTDVDDQVRQIVTREENIMPFLVPGRVLYIKTEKQDWGWGILAGMKRQRVQAKNKQRGLADISQQNEPRILLDVYLYSKKKLTNDSTLQPGNPKVEDGCLGLVPVMLHHSTVHQISTIQLNLPVNHREDLQAGGSKVEALFMELMKRFNWGRNFKQLHPIDDMEIEFDQENDPEDITKLMGAKDRIQGELAGSDVEGLSEVQQEQFQQKEELKDEIKEIEGSIKNASKMIMSKELVNMKRVMRRLDMVDKNDVPSIKGKVAASISASDELLVTELLFSGFFREMEPNQIAAVLSCLIYTDSKSEGQGPKEKELREPFIKFVKVAEEVAKVMDESKIEINKEDYVSKFSADLMEITWRWCQGAKFTEVCEISESIFEGSIIRALRRLDELISQLVEAAKIINNEELGDKFKESQKNLKRGIVFTASLYL